jgi:hypothetical protein
MISEPDFFVEFFHAFPLRHPFGSVKTVAALAAAVRTIRQYEQDPKFQKAPALGAMNVVAATLRTVSFFSVREHPKGASH